MAHRKVAFIFSQAVQFFAQFGLHTSRFAHYRSFTVYYSHNSNVFWPVVKRITCSL